MSRTYTAVATKTPPRSAFVQGEYRPRLTPASDSSSAASPVSEGSGSPSGFTGYTGSTLTTHKSLQKVAPNRRRKREDESILRGAALIRKSLVPRHPPRGIDPPTQRSLFDEDEEDTFDEEEDALGEFQEEDSELEDSDIHRDDEVSHSIRTEEESHIIREGDDSIMIHEEEDNHIFQDDFSDPWTRGKEHEVNLTEIDEATSSLPSSLLRDDDFSAQHSIDEDMHWASMAILPKESGETKNCGEPKRVLAPHWERAEIPSPPRHPHDTDPCDATNVTDGTHVTHMGRGKSLRVKMVTYHVMPLQDMMDDTTCGGSYDGTLESLQLITTELDIETEKKSPPPPPTRKLSLSLPRKKEVAPRAKEIPPPPPPPPPPMPSLSSPLTEEFEDLKRIPAYRHAQDAGYVWQSLVGQHVRFPKQWFDGARGPPVAASDAPWHYIARHSVYANPIFARFVKNRTAAGRILLHLIVRDLMTGVSVFDLAIGIFHPNARGVRPMERPDPKNEGSHHVWMAIRKRTDDVSLMDDVLCRGQRLKDVAKESPIGGTRRNVTNLNMRAIFGEQPPAFTVCIQESELYEKLAMASQRQQNSANAPALLMLQEFLVVVP